MLDASYLHGTIVDAILLVLDLSAGVNGATLTVVCVLSEYGDDRTELCLDASGRIDEVEGIEFVIINASHVDETLVFVCDAGIIAEYASICAPIDQGTTLAALYGAVVNVVTRAWRVGTSCN